MLTYSLSNSCKQLRSCFISKSQTQNTFRSNSALNKVNNATSHRIRFATSSSCNNNHVLICWRLNCCSLLRAIGVLTSKLLIGFINHNYSTSYTVSIQPAHAGHTCFPLQYFKCSEVGCAIILCERTAAAA